MRYIRKRKRNGKIYLEEVESKRIDGKVVQKHIRYIGRQADGKTVLSASISDVQVEQVKAYGPLIVLHHLAQEIGLDQCLGDFSDELLSMVYAHCLDYQRLACCAPRKFYNVYSRLPDGCGCSGGYLHDVRY